MAMRVTVNHMGLSRWRFESFFHQLKSKNNLIELLTVFQISADIGRYRILTDIPRRGVYGGL